MDPSGNHPFYLDKRACCCCPGQGGGPMNPTQQFSIQPFDDTGQLDDEDIPLEDKCCAWCATVDPNIPSIPPQGCYDIDCNDCPNYGKPKGSKPTDTGNASQVIPEGLKKRFQKLANIKK